MLATLQPGQRSPFTRLAHAGTLDMPATALRDFTLAANYLASDSKMRDIIGRAEDFDRPLHLRLNAHGDDSFDPLSDTINWDPHSALQTTAGGRQSPALGLGHELDHATVAPWIRERGSGRYDPAYDNAEERRVIRGSETHAAHTLGEGVRTDHAGSLYSVASPILRRVA